MKRAAATGMMTGLALLVLTVVFSSGVASAGTSSSALCERFASLGKTFPSCRPTTPPPSPPPPTDVCPNVPGKQKSTPCADQQCVEKGGTWNGIFCKMPLPPPSNGGHGHGNQCKRYKSFPRLSPPPACVTPPSINGAITTFAVNDPTTSTTSAHTVNPGDNQMLVVLYGAECGGIDTSATYNGIAMSQGAQTGVGAQAYYGTWYLLNPPQGTHDIVTNFPSCSTRRYAALTIDNVDQDTPFDPGVRVSGIGPGVRTAPLTTTVHNELILYYAIDNPHFLIFTPDDPELWYLTSGFTSDTTGGVPAGFNNYGSKGSAHVQVEAGSTSVGGVGNYPPVIDGNSLWDLIAIPVRPSL